LPIAVIKVYGNWKCKIAPTLIIQEIQAGTPQETVTQKDPMVAEHD
jgi:hypothetical protein